MKNLVLCTDSHGCLQLNTLRWKMGLGTWMAMSAIYKTSLFCTTSLMLFFSLLSLWHKKTEFTSRFVFLSSQQQINVCFIKFRTTHKMELWFVIVLWLFWQILIQYFKFLMPRLLKRGIIGASTIFLSKHIDKYVFMGGSTLYKTDVSFSDVMVNLFSSWLV